MRVLVTGSDGYLGAVLAPRLVEAGHDVVGLDSGLFAGCTFGPEPPGIPTLVRDVRDVRVDDLVGFDAVVHLAALSNDPLGDLDPDLTLAVNGEATATLAATARSAGVRRFVFSSSCSLYGEGHGELLSEEAPFHPVTPYGQSKVVAERALGALASDDFSPTALRNATAYGVSPRLRLDVVVNNLVAHAVTSGRVLLESDGSPWRPLVHVQDIAAAFAAVLDAPRELVHGEAFNVGRTGENLQIRTIAEMVGSALPGCRVQLADGAGPDRRDYRVDFAKLARTLPSFQPAWTVARGIDELVQAFVRHGLDEVHFHSDRFIRVARLRTLIDRGLVDDSLRRTEAASA
jgi:nucleoside-diphosphate-sugar epimerase